METVENSEISGSSGCDDSSEEEYGLEEDLAGLVVAPSLVVPYQNEPIAKKNDDSSASDTQLPMARPYTCEYSPKYTHV